MRKLLLIASTLALVLAGCASSGPTITVNSAAGTNLSDFQTFNFMQPLGTDRDNGGEAVTEQGEQHDENLQRNDDWRAPQQRDEHEHAEQPRRYSAVEAAVGVSHTDSIACFAEPRFTFRTGAKIA